MADPLPIDTQGAIALDLVLFLLGVVAKGQVPQPEAIIGIFLRQLKGKSDLEAGFAREKLLSHLEPAARERAIEAGLGHQG
jgi:hypothetical protein